MVESFIAIRYFRTGAKVKRLLPSRRGRNSPRREACPTRGSASIPHPGSKEHIPVTVLSDNTVTGTCCGSEAMEEGQRVARKGLRRGLMVQFPGRISRLAAAREQQVMQRLGAAACLRSR